MSNQGHAREESCEEEFSEEEEGGEEEEDEQEEEEEDDDEEDEAADEDVELLIVEFSDLFHEEFLCRLLSLFFRTEVQKFNMPVTP